MEEVLIVKRENTSLKQFSDILNDSANLTFLFQKYLD